MVELTARSGRDVSSAELAGLLGVSRESVYQLLLPLARAGFVRVGRGRNGGYRAAPGAGELSVAAVVEPFDRGDGERARAQTGPPYVTDLERRAAEASRRVLAATRVGELAAAVRASREALSWEI